MAGILNVGVYGASALNIVPKILSAFTETHPEVQIRLHNAHRSPADRRVATERVLVALTVTCLTKMTCRRNSSRGRRCR